MSNGAIAQQTIGDTDLAKIGMDRTQSGVIIPSGLAREAAKRPTQYDPDGRRRLVLSKQAQKQINVLLRGLGAEGLGLLVGCANRYDGKEPCGQPLINEGRGGPDEGYGCACTRVHFL